MCAFSHRKYAVTAHTHIFLRTFSQYTSRSRTPNGIYEYSPNDISAKHLVYGYGMSPQNLSKVLRSTVYRAHVFGNMFSTHTSGGSSIRNVFCARRDNRECYFSLRTIMDVPQTRRTKNSSSICARTRSGACGRKKPMPCKRHKPAVCISLTADGKTLRPALKQIIQRG